MNDKLLEIIKKYEKPGDFLYSKVDDEVINRIERALEVKLPKQYADYIRMFGDGGLFDIEIFGVGQTGRLIVVDTNLVLREDDFPENYVAFSGHEKYMDCIDCDTGHILYWDFEEFKVAYECFDDYLLDCINKAIDNAKN